MHIRQAERFRRGLRLVSRFSAVSKAYRRPSRVHERAQRQRLAACAGAEVHAPSRGAAARPDSSATDWPRPAPPLCPPGTADAAAARVCPPAVRPPGSRASAGRRCRRARTRQDFLAAGKQRVDPQVQRRRREQAPGQRSRLATRRVSRARRSYTQSGRLSRIAGGSCAWSTYARACASHWSRPCAAAVRARAGCVGRAGQRRQHQPSWLSARRRGVSSRRRCRSTVNTSSATKPRSFWPSS